MKNRILLGAGALVVVAVPAVLGLWGNASFAESVPVRVPTQAVTSTPSPSESADDRGGDVPRDDRTEPGDDRDVQGGTSPSTSPSPSPSADDHGGDDNGTDDNGTGDNGTDDVGDDHGGSGSEDSGSDDSSGDEHGGSGTDDSGHGGDDRSGGGHGGGEDD